MWVGGWLQTQSSRKILYYVFNLFLIFKMKVLPLLNNVNDEVSSNHKDEVSTMMTAVPNQSYAVTHYASHHRRSNVQFSAIEKLCGQWKQIHPSFIWFRTTNKTFYRWYIGRYKLIILVKSQEFVGNYGDKVESWWGSQWVLI